MVAARVKFRVRLLAKGALSYRVPPTTHTMTATTIFCWLSLCLSWRIPFVVWSPVKALGLRRTPKEEDTRDLDQYASAGVRVDGIGDGLITAMPAAFFNASVLSRLSATGLLGGVLVLEDDAAGAAETAVGGRGGAPDASLPVSAGGSGGGGGAACNPDVKTPQVCLFWSPHGRGVLLSRCC